RSPQAEEDARCAVRLRPPARPWRTRARAPAPEFRCAVLRARAGRWLSARLHADVIHKRGLRPLLRAVDAPDPAQFFGDLRPVPARIVAAPSADDLVGALGCVSHARPRRGPIDKFPPAQPYERGAVVVTGHARTDGCHGTILP